MRAELRMTMSVPVRALKQARSNQWLDQEPVYRLVWNIYQRESRQIDLLIPEFKQAVVGAKRLGQGRIKREARSTRAFRQPIRKFSRRHWTAVSEKPPRGQPQRA